MSHEGSLLVAKEMVSAAHLCRCMADIKHQTHVVEDEMCQVAKQVIPETLRIRFMTLWRVVR